jgi:integrase
MRHRNGVKKRCRCGPRAWPKCADSWWLDSKPRGGRRYRFSLDEEMSRRIDSRTEAEEIAISIRAAINAGTFERAAERRAREQREASAASASAQAAAAGAITMRAFGETYLQRARGKPRPEVTAAAPPAPHRRPRGPRAIWKNDHGMLNRLYAFSLAVGDAPMLLGDKPLGAITEDDIEAFFDHLQRQGTAASTRNKYVQLVTAMFRWALKKGYLARNPIADSEVIRRGKMAQRKRRLEPDVLNDRGQLARAGEERRLLQHAPPHLQRLIIAALETGCRRGELLSLTWADVDLPHRELTIRAANAKDREQRILPISSRLAGVLEMARTDAAGREYPASAYVFGELGEPLVTIKKAWETTVLKAHGHTPKWAASGKLSAASRAELRAINLHFHDLRHEAGSRLIEQGWPVHHVQEMLGHASLEQTSTYLNVTRAGLHDSMRRYEHGEREGIRGTSVAHGAAIEHPPVSHAATGQHEEPTLN